MHKFDYVIIGGGTAGCILADKLSASGRHTVLMIEAGEEPKNIWLKIPAGFTKLLNSTRFNWRFSTQPESGTKDRVIPIHRGKGLGGSSLINGMIYVRGQSDDYNGWIDSVHPNWDYENIEPYFHSLEQYQDGDAIRGRAGPLYLEQVKERFALSTAFLEAAVEAGYKTISDYNGADQEGFGYYQVNQRNGQRWGVYEAFLQPARRRKNLKVMTHAHALKLLLEDTRCVGVELLHEGRHELVHANVEVILAAGAVQSPQLLELSGIGQPKLLESLGITVKHALNGVGENYIDHYVTRMNWRVKNTSTLNEMSRGHRLALAVLQYFTCKKGILTLATGLVHGFVRTDASQTTPDAQFMFVNASYANAGVRKLDTAPGMTIGVMPLRPQSKGSIHIQTADPFKQPAILPNFLSDYRDHAPLIESMKIAREIVAQNSLNMYVDHAMDPPSDVLTDEDWLAFARRNGQTGSHPIGTCRMGSDDMSVVDARLKVHGVDGLRIVDASVIPKMISGNIQAAVMVVALRAADLILEEAP